MLPWAIQFSRLSSNSLLQGWVTWGEDAEHLVARETPSHLSCLHRGKAQGRASSRSPAIK